MCREVSAEAIHLALPLSQRHAVPNCAKHRGAKASRGAQRPWECALWSRKQVTEQVSVAEKKEMQKGESGKRRKKKGESRKEKEIKREPMQHFFSLSHTTQRSSRRSSKKGQKQAFPPSPNRGRRSRAPCNRGSGFSCWFQHRCATTPAPAPQQGKEGKITNNILERRIGDALWSVGEAKERERGAESVWGAGWSKAVKQQGMRRGCAGEAPMLNASICRALTQQALGYT